MSAVPGPQRYRGYVNSATQEWADDVVYAWCMCLLKGMPERVLWIQQKSLLGGISSLPVHPSQTVSTTPL